MKPLFYTLSALLIMLIFSNCEKEGPYIRMSVFAEVKHPSGHLRTDGSITLKVSMGKAPYNYSWNNGSKSAQLSNLGPGTYSCTITDATGATVKTNNLEITDPGKIRIVTFDGNSRGYIKLTVGGGWGPYTVTWPDNTTGTEFTNKTPGDYVVKITTSTGDFAYDTAHVPQKLVDFDGNSYHVFVVNNAWWTWENYRCTRAADGSKLTSYELPLDIDQNRTFGRYYDDDEAERIPPVGWRIPTNEDFISLFKVFNISYSHVKYTDTETFRYDYPDIIRKYFPSQDSKLILLWNVNGEMTINYTIGDGIEKSQELLCYVLNDKHYGLVFLNDVKDYGTINGVTQISQIYVPIKGENYPWGYNTIRLIKIN